MPVPTLVVVEERTRMLARRTIAVLAGVLVLATTACAEDGGSPTGSPADGAGPTASPQDDAGPTVSPEGPAPTASPSPEPDTLTPGPPAGYDEPSLAADPLHLAELRLGSHDGFERAVLEFATLDDGTADDRAPAVRPPGHEVELVPEHGAVRIHLTDVPAGAPDVTVRDRSGLVTHAYHATAMQGTHPAVDTWVDLYTTEPVAAETFGLTDPGRVVIDLEPSEGSWGSPADRSDLGVLLAPDPDTSHDRELPVAGYARPFEAAAPLRVESPDGTVVHEEVLRTAAWAEAHGTFETTVDVSGWAPGEYRVVVEEEPAAEEADAKRLETTVTIG